MVLTKNKENKSGKSPWQLESEATGFQIRMQLSSKLLGKSEKAFKWKTSQVNSGEWISERQEMIQVIGVYSLLGKWESKWSKFKRHKGHFSIYFLSYSTTQCSFQSLGSVVIQFLSFLPYQIYISPVKYNLLLEECVNDSLYSSVKQLVFVLVQAFSMGNIASSSVLK